MEESSANETIKQEVLGKSRRERAPNLTKREQESLLSGVSIRKSAVFGDINSPNYSEKTNRAWEEIAREVNAVNTSGARREAKWLRDRFSKWKSDVKKKVAQNARERKITGGGEGNFEELRGCEKMLADLLTTEEVTGLKGALEVGLVSKVEEQGAKALHAESPHDLEMEDEPHSANVSALDFDLPKQSADADTKPKWTTISSVQDSAQKVSLRYSHLLNISPIPVDLKM